MLGRRGEELIGELGGVVEEARGFVSPTNRANVERALADLAGTAEAARGLVVENRRQVEATMAEARAAVGRLRAIAENAEGMVGELRPEVRELVVQLREAVSQAEATLAQAGDAVDAVDARRLNELVRSLETTSRNFAELSREIKEQPSLLLRRRKTTVEGLEP